LDLSWNELEVIGVKMFTGLVSLVELQCEFNKIKTIKHNSFDVLRDLRVLDLRCNKLKFLVEKDFDKQNELDIRGNYKRLTPDESCECTSCVCELDFCICELDRYCECH
jgi:hypothetical protein